MKLSDKEANKIMAYAIIKSQQQSESSHCMFCNGFEKHNQHTFDCPVLLAEEVLKDIENCTACPHLSENGIMCGNECSYLAKR